MLELLPVVEGDWGEVRELLVIEEEEEGKLDEGEYMEICYISEN